MFSNLKKIIRTNFINMQGWHTNRKIIVIESDDWGSIRIPSKRAYNNLLNSGIRVDLSKYDRMDCLESQADLLNLFELLGKYKDKKCNPPVFTFNTVLGNPDFEKIKENSFDDFYHMNLWDSYQYYFHEDNRLLWKEGIEKKLIRPQFHAKEHLQTSLWMKDLKSGNKETRIGFENNFFGVKTTTSSKFQKHYLAAYNADTFEDFKCITKNTIEGLQLFEAFFEFKSRSFIGCNYTWPKELEKVLHDNDVKILQGQRGQIVPDFMRQQKKMEYHYTGQKNELGQIYTIRNVKFEPYENHQIDWVSKAFKEIENAFFWGKPAIISTHRVNYVSGLDKENSERSLKALDLLLKKITTRWPDVEFKSSDELF